jgi:hypothetical protein
MDRGATLVDSGQALWTRAKPAPATIATRLSGSGMLLATASAPSGLPVLPLVALMFFVRTGR